MTERLDRIEAILERNAEQMAQSQQRHDIEIAEIRQLQASNARSIEANSNAIADLRQAQAVAQEAFRASVEDTMALIGILGKTSDRQLASIQEMQSEVKGLQTENRRILEQLEARFGGQGEV